MEEKVRNLYTAYDREPVILLSTLIDEIEIEPEIYNWRYDEINFMNPMTAQNWTDLSLA